MITVPRRAALALVAAAFALGACSGASPATPAPSAPATASPAASESPAGTVPPTPVATDGATSPPAASATPSPSPAAVLDAPWATAELVDVATGEAFTIAGLVAAGRPVIVETMAIWCTNCLTQQRRIEEALEREEPGAAAYVVLTVDPSEDASKLARYREQQGFDGIYAVAGRDVARALADEFGDQVLNPPATPVVIISPAGRVTLTPFGPKSADDIATLLAAHRS
jgi:thiol-disulfide isomerase/thioredoxin